MRYTSGLCSGLGDTEQSVFLREGNQPNLETGGSFQISQYLKEKWAMHCLGQRVSLTALVPLPAFDGLIEKIGEK